MSTTYPGGLSGDCEKRLEERGIRATAIRILILRAMLLQDRAFSLSDLEEQLDTVDKSTLFRTLSLFHEKLLIHSIDDGSGAMKYSVCNRDCLCLLNDLHVHFYCVYCKKTFCLENIPIPAVKLPARFVLTDENFVLKGYCDKCCKFAT
jgi:Fur family ferric uptake transcriptional regulator